MVSRPCARSALQIFCLKSGVNCEASADDPVDSRGKCRSTANRQPHDASLTDMAVATSGDRWHQRASEGRRWSHTIDPRTGEPTTHALASVTVLHAECMQADALATVLTVLGPDEGLDFAERHDIAALFVSHDESSSMARTTRAWREQTEA